MKVLAGGSRRLVSQSFYLGRMGYEEVPKVAQVINKGVQIGLVHLVRAVGQHVPKEAVHEAKSSVKALVLGDEKRNPFVGQVEPGILAKLRIHPSELSSFSRPAC